MPEVELLEKIVSDLDFLKKKVVEIEESIEDINIDIHHVKPEYLKKLEAIKKEGTVSSTEFEKKFGIRI